MNNKYLFFTVFILITLILSLVFLLKPSTQKVIENPKIENNIVPTFIKEESSTPIANNNNYVIFNNNLEDFKNENRLLFFYANWCPTCQAANSDINNNLNNLPNDLTIIRINYNDTETNEEEKEIAKKYGVSYQHSFVLIDLQGNEIKKWNGGGFSDILKNLK